MACFGCKEKGHCARECPEKNNGSRRLNNAHGAQAVEGVANVTRIYLALEHREVEHQAMIIEE